MWYSKNGEYPVEGLPDRIKLSTGQTRTDSSTFTPAEIADAGYQSVLPPPSKQPYEILSWENNTWVVTDPRTVEGEKSRLLGNLSDKRKEAEENFTFGGAPITLDEGTQARINAAMIGLERSPEGTTTPWQVSRGVFTQFNLATLQALGVAAFNHVRLCFVNSQTLATQIMAGTTLAELDAIDLDVGWP
jgi:hypothetical protein